MTIEAIMEAKARRLALIRTVAADLVTHGEFYSGDVWEAWCSRLRRPDVTKRQAWPMIQGVLREMEDEGLLRSRNVLPDEHGGSQLIRRYYEGCA